MHIVPQRGRGPAAAIVALAVTAAVSASAPVARAADGGAGDGGAGTPGAATAISSVVPEAAFGSGIRVVVRGNGRIEAQQAGYASEPPARIFLDIRTGASMPTVTSFNHPTLRRIRMAPNAPGVMRVVIVLTDRFAYRIERIGPNGDDLAVVIDDTVRLAAPVAAAAKADASASRRAPSTNPAGRDAPITSVRVTTPGGRPAATSSADTATSRGDASNGPGSATSSEDEGSDEDETPTQAPLPPSLLRKSAPPAASSASGQAYRDEEEENARGAQWFTIRGLRLAVGANYETTDVELDGNDVSGYRDRTAGPIATVQGTFAVIDPRILSIDAMADVRLSWRRYQSDAQRTKTNDALRNYRLNLSLLSGRGSPLRLYWERFGMDMAQRQALTSGGTESLLDQTGIQSTKGFSWDLAGKRAPHVSAAGYITNRKDAGSFLFGADSNSRQAHLDVRADKTTRLLRYDVGYLHDNYRFKYPLVGVATESGYDFLRGTTHFTPTPRLTLDAGARFSTFSFGRSIAGSVNREFGGAGTDLGASWDWTRRLRLSASYTGFVSNRSVTLAAPVDSSLPVSSFDASRRTWYQNYDGRMVFTSTARTTTAAVFARGTSLDPAPFVPATLDTLNVAGAEGDRSFKAAGFDFSIGGEFAGGQARSNRGDTESYGEAAGRARVARSLGRARVAFSGGGRRTTTLYFYPVGGNAWFGTGDVSVDFSRQLRARASASRSFLLNDLVYQRSDDRADSVSAGVSGQRFDINADYTETTMTSAALLDGSLVAGTRPDDLLGASMYGLTWGGQQTLRSVNARFTPWRGLEIYGRGRRDRLFMPAAIGVNRLDQEVAQAGVIWGVRQLQFELGWQYLDSSSLVAGTVDRRLFIRIRRDLPIF